MQKCLIFLLALISFSVQARANWNPYIMDHERFSNLETKDKHALIVRTMEMMVELEAKYEREVKVSGYSFERFQKYVQILSKLQSLIISNAVADDYKSKSDTFTKLMNSSKSCIFAGWASEIVIKNGESKCGHPATSKNEAVRNAYGATKNGCSPNQISCNPMVFGFKKNANSTPFCVQTGFTSKEANKAHNVSYECMRASLTVEKSAKQDSKAERLAAMTDAISKNPEAFNKVQNYIFRTCACTDADNKMDQIYKDYIRPHRTCYGLMNSLRHFGYKECSDLTNSLADNKVFVDQWNEYFNDNNIKELKVPLTKEPEEFDKAYGDIMKNPLVAQYCEKGFVPPAKDKKEWVCNTTCASVDPVSPETKKTISCTIDQASWKITKDGQEEFKTAELEKMTIDDAQAPKTKVKLKDTSEEDQECPVSVAVVEKVEVIKPSCKISFTQEKEQSKATVSFENLDKNEVTEINWKVGEADPKAGVETEILLGKDDKKVFVEFSFKDEKGVVGEKQSCPGEVPEKDDGDKTVPTLDVEAEAAKPTLVKLNAKVSLGGKPLTMPSPEGLHLSWFRSKDGGKTIAPFVKPAETKLDDSAKTLTDQEIKDAAAAAAAAPVVPEGEFSQDESVTELRLEKAYETCARLIDAQGATVVEKICKSIPALEKSKNNNNNNYNQNPNAPRPTFIVPKYNTRQQGIQ